MILNTNLGHLTTGDLLGTEAIDFDLPAAEHVDNFVNEFVDFNDRGLRTSARNHGFIYDHGRYAY